MSSSGRSTEDRAWCQGDTCDSVLGTYGTVVVVEAEGVTDGVVVTDVDGVGVGVVDVEGVALGVADVGV